jgi:hypothetical protein
MLTDGAVTRIEGAPLPGHVPSSNNGRWGEPCHLCLRSHWIGVERSADDPERCTGKILDNAQSPREISGHPGVPRGGSQASTVLAHNAGPRLAGGRHLQTWAMCRAQERPQGIPGFLEEDLSQRQFWPMTQGPIWRTSATCSPGRCVEPGRDLRVSLGSSRRTPGNDSPGPRRRTLCGGRAPLAARRPS